MIGTFIDSLVSVCTTFFFMAAILPAMIYGAFIGRRIVRKEPKSSWFRKFFVTLLFACIGGAIFPITICIMIYNWEYIENDIDRALRKAIRFFRRFGRRAR